MKKLIIAIALLGCCATNANAVDWVDASAATAEAYGPSKTTATDLGGYYYRIKSNGRILRKAAGTSHYSGVAISSIPRAYQATVIQMYELYVDQSTESSTSVTQARTRTQTTTTDSRRYDRHIDRHDARRHDRHDASSFRDRDVRYRLHTRGNHAPAVVANNNFRSSVTVNVHPASETMALAIFGENRRLTQEVIAANRSRSQSDADLRIERAKPPRVEIRTVRVKSHCCGHSCKQVTLCAKDWKCGSHFTDQYGHRWNRTDGPAMKHLPRSVTGCLDFDPHGMARITIKWRCGTTVFVDP